MFISSRERGMISGIDWKIVLAYVQSHGWKKKPWSNDLATAWAHPSLVNNRDWPFTRVLVPATRDAADYDDCIWGAVNGIARVEDRPLFEVLTHLFKASQVAKISGLTEAVE